MKNKLKYYTSEGARMAALFVRAHKYRLSSQEYANRLNLAVVDEDAELISSMIKMRVLSYNFDRAIKHFYIASTFFTIKHASSRVLHPDEQDTIKHFLYLVSFAAPLLFEWSKGLTKSGQFGPAGLLELIAIGIISYHFQFVTGVRDVEATDLVVGPFIGMCIKEMCIIAACFLSQDKNQYCHLGKDKKIYQKALLDSINNRSIDVVKVLISELPHAILEDIVDQNGLSPLQIAVKHNNPKIFNLLVEHGFGIEFNTFSKLFDCIEMADFITPNLYNLLFLKISGTKNKFNEIKAFLNNPEFKDNLISSVPTIMNNDDILDLIMDIKGTGFMRDDELLYHAFVYGNYSAIRKLVKYCSDLNSVFLESSLERAKDDQKKSTNFIKIAVIFICNQITIDVDLFRKNLIDIDQILGIMSEGGGSDKMKEKFILNKLELLCGIANLLIAEVAIKLIEDIKDGVTGKSVTLPEEYNIKLQRFANENITKIDFSEIKKVLKNPLTKEFWQVHEILKNSLHTLYKLKSIIKHQEKWAQDLLESIEVIEEALGLFSLHYLSKTSYDESIGENDKIAHQIFGFLTSQEIGILANTCQHPENVMEPSHLLVQNKLCNMIGYDSTVESELNTLIGVTAGH
ncbi:hypothetical protein phytr_5750 [Candidatus Phycorickettsia trachydisci]|uniref:Uncharacterized protein n=1 Tax=Candidatus Phycorickettsia trachydisci TaxID=2115978 RepID=A0A2P1P8B6_9RICK|nr:ankyrin repeat domain-containing protein [Candidatus Phycorickettsia trachydisci]AVP87518.1 hypothetical protein phytr_5750 [Candidatus Phycorickettsia trachydisci]